VAATVGPWPYLLEMEADSAGSTIGFHAADPDYLPVLNEAFRRRGQSPLRLYANEHEECSGYNDFLRDVVCSQSKRITELTLSIYWETFKKFLALPQDSFPVLESVLLLVIDSGLNRPNLRMPHGVTPTHFRGAACLRRIDINIVQTPQLDAVFLPINFGLCWPQLTHINFRNAPIQVPVAHELVKLCASLDSCSLLLMADIFLELPFPAASICLPHLRKLVVLEAGPDPSVLAKFIRPPVLPALEDFDLFFPGEDFAGGNHAPRRSGAHNRGLVHVPRPCAALTTEL